MPIDIDHDVLASITSICYKPRTGIGYLRLSRGHVPDMGGTIRLFTRINPAVRHILCYDGRHLNTRYSRFGAQWECTLLELPAR